MMLYLFLFVLMFSGCVPPCTYHGKPVPKADAEFMKSLGMQLDCPGE